jgi:hypothetical protein
MIEAVRKRKYVEKEVPLILKNKKQKITYTNYVDYEIEWSKLFHLVKFNIDNKIKTIKQTVEENAPFINFETFRKRYKKWKINGQTTNGILLLFFIFISLNFHLIFLFCD